MEELSEKLKDVTLERDQFKASVNPSSELLSRENNLLKDANSQLESSLTSLQERYDLLAQALVDGQTALLTFSSRENAIRAERDNLIHTSQDTDKRYKELLEKYLVLSNQEKKSSISHLKITHDSASKLCQGCRENQSNQLAHVGTDGCLEEKSEISSITDDGVEAALSSPNLNTAVHTAQDSKSPSSPRAVECGVCKGMKKSPLKKGGRRLKNPCTC